MPNPTQKNEPAALTAEQLAQYQNAMGLLQKLNNNPEARKHLEKSMKVINPDLETEEDVAARVAKPYVEQIAALGEEVKGIKEAQAKREREAQEAADAANTSKAMSWLDEQDFTEEGKTRIKAIMVERGIADVQAAAAFFEKQNPKPVAIPGANYQSDSWDLRGASDDKNLKELFANEDAWGDREAANTLNEIRRNQAQLAVA